MARLSKAVVGHKLSNQAKDEFLSLVFSVFGLSKQLFHTQISQYNACQDTPKDPKTVVMTRTFYDLTLELVTSNKATRILFVSKGKTSREYLAMNSLILTKFLPRNKSHFDLPVSMSTFSRLMFRPHISLERAKMVFTKLADLVESAYRKNL